MKITKVSVQRGKRIILDEQREESYEIQIDAQVGEQDDPQELVHSLKSVLDKHLASWEFELQGKKSTGQQQGKVVIQTANDLITSANDNENKEQEQIMTETKQEQFEEVSGSLVCPKCNEVMTKKEGKDYYLCSKHWGYPDMIRKGQVREKKF